MNNNLKFDFDVDHAAHGVTVVREFAAPLARVWEAWTRPELIDQWWAPKPWTAKTKELELRAGGRWLYAMIGPNGSEQWCRAIYSRIDAPEGYSYEDASCDAEGNVTDVFPGSRWDVSFAATGDTTTVTVRISHKSAEDLEKILQMGFREGFSMGLANLDEVLAAGI